MLNRLTLGLFLFVGPGACFGANIVFYTSPSSFQAAIAGLAQQTITFDDLATGSYQPFTTQGVTFSGDTFGLFVRDQASWTFPFFGSATGNSLATGGAYNIHLPDGISAAGFRVGSTFISVTGSQLSVVEALTADGASTGTVIASLSNLFPFLGVVSDTPIMSLQITGGAFLTIDNFAFAGAGAVPEPGTAWLLAVPSGWLMIRRRLRR